MPEGAGRREAARGHDKDLLARLLANYSVRDSIRPHNTQDELRENADFSNSTARGRTRTNGDDKFSRPVP